MGPFDIDTIEIDAVADGLGHGDVFLQCMLLEPLHLFGMDLYLSSNHFLIGHGDTPVPSAGAIPVEHPEGTPEKCAALS